MITSPHNPHIKLLRSLLRSRQSRRDERLFVVEGVRLAEEALATGSAVAFAAYSPAQLAATERGRALLGRLESLPEANPASPELLAAISDTVSPQGVIAAVAWPALSATAGGLQLLLDAVQDPGNLGTLLRSAEATGVRDVLCLPGTADVFNPKVVRAAMGAHFRLPIVHDIGWDQAPALLLVDNVYAAVAGASIPYYAADWRQPSALIVGNEANGISPDGLQIATKLISIPMAAPVESLNAAVAGSIVLFEAQRQRRLGRS